MTPHLAILGPGLLGGSLAMACKSRGGGRVSVWARREEAVAEVRDRGCADVASTDVRKVVADADVVVFATPIGAMPSLAREIVEYVKPTALVTDVGSVKAPVVRELAPLFAGRAEFIGSHPMAGSEQTGLGAARADLFEGAVTIVTPEAGTPAARTARVRAFWEGVGCTVRQVGPEEHDLMVGWVSHLPHLLAATLINTVEASDPEAFEFCGPGFRDATRIASGPPSMWTEILGENRLAVHQALDGLIENLRAVSTLLASAPNEERDALMNQLLTEAKGRRDRLRLPNVLSDA
jgi:prephenate dehydrogenase